MEGLLQTLLQSINQFESAQLSQLDINRENEFANINNTLNANNVLYSSAPATAQTQYDAQQYIPNYSAIQQSAFDQRLASFNSYQQAIDQINSYNEAAGLLSGNA